MTEANLAGIPGGPSGPGRDLSDQLRQRHHGVMAMTRVRWGAVLFALLQVYTYYTDYPPGLQAVAFGLAGVLACGNAAIRKVARRTLDARGIDRVAVASLGLDLLCVLGFVALYTFDVETSIWAVLYVLPLEGALLYQKRGAFMMMALAGGGYLVREVIGSSVIGYPFEPDSVTFRTGIGFIIAAMAGATTSQLATERNRVQKSERQLGALLEESRDVIAVLNRDWTFSYVSPAIRGILGFDASELVGRSALDFVLDEDRSQVLAALGTVAQVPGKTVELVYRGRHRDGHLVWFHTKGTNALEDGAVDGILANIHDITETKLAEEELARTNQQLASFLANLPGMAYRCRNDRDWTLEFVSEGSLELTGYSADHLMSDAVAYNELIHPGDRERVWGQVQAGVKSGSPFQMEYRVVMRDGTERWVWEQGHVVDTGPDGMMLEGIVIDATQRKLLEGQLARSQKMEAVGQLAGGIAHDFNNLLAVVTNYAALMMDDVAADSQLHADLQEIHGAGMRGADLVRQLLAFSSQEMTAPRAVDPNDVVAEMMNLLMRSAGEHIEIRTSLQARSHTLIDRAQLEQVLMNLVVNARDAMPRGGTLRLQTSEASGRRKSGGVRGPEQRWVVLTVEDDGEGMTPEIVERIYDPFFTTKQQGRGTGLGLATTYGIVDRAGGWIDVSSQPGSGTKFEIFLPITAPDAIEDAEDASARHDERAQGSSILVVEDEAPVRRVVERILTSKGHRVTTAASADEAFACLQEHTVDLLITDVMMPGLSGQAMVEALRRRGDSPNVIYMSGYDEGLVSKQGALRDRDVLIQKPFSQEALLTAVNASLAAAS